MLQKKTCSICKEAKDFVPQAGRHAKASGFFGRKCWPCYLEHKKPGNLVASKKWYDQNATPEFLAKETQRHLAWQKENPGKANANTARRRNEQANRTPSWADHEKINLFYAEASAQGLEVDHIYPLQGKLVSGLHVHTNMQLLTRSENASKGNRVNK